MAQSVERILGKDEVTGSIPVSSLDMVQSQGNEQENALGMLAFQSAFFCSFLWREPDSSKMRQHF